MNISKPKTSFLGFQKQNVTREGTQALLAGDENKLALPSAAAWILLPVDIALPTCDVSTKCVQHIIFLFIFENVTNSITRFCRSNVQFQAPVKHSYKKHNTFKKKQNMITQLMKLHAFNKYKS